MITIGINYGGYHDSSACIMQDGELLFASAEERFSRIKHDGRFPRLALNACFEFTGVNPDEVDAVCAGSVLPWRAYCADLKSYLAGKIPLAPRDALLSLNAVLKMCWDRNGAKSYKREFGVEKTPFRVVDHHFAHAISAYACSGFDDSAVLVVDGRGSWQATSIWHGIDGRLRNVLTIPWPNSLGLFYASLTGYLGFTPNQDEWKVMGLAPYGQPSIDLSNLINLEQEPYRVDSQRLSDQMWTTHAPIVDLLGPGRQANEEINDRQRDIAFAVQSACETAMLALSRMAREKTGSPNLCLAGGVALNSKANGKITASGVFDEVFVQPAPGDDGTAIGAALVPYMKRAGRLPNKRMNHTYFGRSFSNIQVESLLKGYKLRYKQIHEPAQITADLLTQSKIVGWFQSRAEFGPRALGNRSILADPRQQSMPLRLNSAVKFRESWRPFAPSILSEYAHSYIEGKSALPFMSITANVRADQRELIPAVTHVDGSTRPQTVKEEYNPLFWSLINEFRKRTGVPVLLNTSFNLQGEPIVESPSDALRTFFSSGMDALVMGEYLLEK